MVAVRVITGLYHYVRTVLYKNPAFHLCGWYQYGSVEEATVLCNYGIVLIQYRLCVLMLHSIRKVLYQYIVIKR
jgi:hypothetical protein